VKCAPNCLDLMQAKPLIPLANVSSGTGTPSTGSNSFRVWGFHPLLRIAVYVFFQVKTGNPNGGAHTWTANGLKKAPDGQVRTLQPIFNPASQTLEDGREFNSAAEGVLFTCSFGEMQTSSSSGTWLAEVQVMPNEPMSEALFKDLFDRVKIDTPVPLALKASAT
jgi:hypothetical protein